MHSCWSIYQGAKRNLCSDKCKCLRKSDYFFLSTGAYHQGPCPVQGGLAASLAGRYAGGMVWECAGIWWMAHAEGKMMKIGLALVECRNLFLSREAWRPLKQAGKPPCTWWLSS